MDVEFAHQIELVSLDGFDAHSELCRCLSNRAPFGQQAHHYMTSVPLQVDVKTQKLVSTKRKRTFRDPDAKLVELSRLPPFFAIPSAELGFNSQAAVANRY